MQVLDAGQLIPQLLRQYAGDAILADAHGLGNVFQGILRDEVVLRLAEQKPDGRIVILRFEQAVDGGKVEIQLSGILRLELPSFQLDHYIAAELQVVEQQIEIEIVAAHVQMILIAEERKACSKLQKQPGNLGNQSPLDVPFHHILAEGDKIEDVRVLHHLLRQLALLRRQRRGEVVDLMRERLTFVQPAFYLVNKDVAGPAVLCAGRKIPASG